MNQQLLIAALEDVELSCTQARLASQIGKKKDRTEFLRGALERIANAARTAIDTKQTRWVMKDTIRRHCISTAKENNER